jgi:hypothetical protein
MNNHKVSEKVIRKLITELNIPKEREDELHKILMEAFERADSSPVDDIKTFIKITKKANELAFLAFTYGINTGGIAVQSMLEEQIPGLINHAANIGAKMALERAGAGEPTALPQPKDEKPEVMYQ